MCQREKGTAQTLLEAAKLSVSECQRQFSTERWNCSLGTFRLNLIEQGRPIDIMIYIHLGLYAISENFQFLVMPQQAYLAKVTKHFLHIRPIYEYFFY